jgi:hypothetical protein
MPSMPPAWTPGCAPRPSARCAAPLWSRRMHPAPRGKLLRRRGRPIRNPVRRSLRRAVDPCRHRTACASRSPEIRSALLLHLRRQLPSCIMLAPLMYLCCPRQPHDDKACAHCTCSSAPHQFLVAALCSVPKLSGVRPALSPALFVLECFNLFHSHFTFPCFSVNTVCWHAVVQACQRQWLAAVRLESRGGARPAPAVMRRPPSGSYFCDRLLLVTFYCPSIATKASAAGPRICPATQPVQHRCEGTW